MFRTNMNNECVIVVPVHKEHLSEYEKMSLLQLQYVVQNKDIVVVYPNTINKTVYAQHIQQSSCNVAFKSVDSMWLASAQSYNIMCMSKWFYDMFANYKYMLIYQLDCWLFKDEIAQWCQRSYDYIGAPWFKNFSNDSNELMAVGNGGFSLRNVKVFQSLLSRNDLPQPKFIVEDFYFCMQCKQHLKIPSCKEAACFSFECNPSWLYENITHKQLPMGCHAWQKYQYDAFWKKIIHLS